MKISKQLTDYFDHCQYVRNYTKQTMCSKRKILNKFAKVNQLRKAEDITTKLVDSWRKSLIESGITPRTVNTRTAHVVAFVKYAQSRGVKIDFNFNLIKPIKEDPVERLHFSPEEIRLVLQQARNERDYLFLAVMFEAGLRINELATLQVDQIDFEICRLRVVGKGRKLRITYITEPTAERLRLWCERSCIEVGYVFPSPMHYGSHISTDQIRYVLKSMFNKAGFDKFYPHAVRHSSATNWGNNGMDVTSVATLLGHKNPVTTMQYYHLNDKIRKEYQKAMEYA